MITKGVLFDQLFFLAKNVKNELVRILTTAKIEKRESGLGTSPRAVKLIPRSPGSISSLYGVKTNLKAKNSLFATSKTMSRIQNGLSPHSGTYSTAILRSMLQCCVLMMLLEYFVSRGLMFLFFFVSRASRIVL